MKEFLNKLYSNVGGKLQVIAKICGIVGLVCAAIGLLLMLYSGFDDEMILAGVGCMVTGISCIVSSWPLYAFGQLVNDVHSMKLGANKETEFESFELPEI